MVDGMLRSVQVWDYCEHSSIMCLMDSAVCDFAKMRGFLIDRVFDVKGGYVVYCRVRDDFRCLSINELYPFKYGIVFGREYAGYFREFVLDDCVIFNYCKAYTMFRFRTERRENDPLVPISEIFNEFIENCKLNYSLSSCVLLWMRCYYYLFNAYIYAGQNADGFIGLTLDHKQEGHFLSLHNQLYGCQNQYKPQGTNRNVTANNWFSSIELNELLKKKKLT
ncbi:hypothetical protein QTP88_008197 [Uroleucon formosanum]